MIEFIGILAGIFILISLSFKSISDLGNLIMRFLNIGGSILFVIYGFLIPAYSTAIVNMCTIIINIINIISIIKNQKKKLN